MENQWSIWPIEYRHEKKMHDGIGLEIATINVLEVIFFNLSSNIGIDKHP